MDILQANMASKI